MGGFVGMDDLLGDLSALNGRIMSEAAFPALEETADAVVTDAKAGTPVLSGALRDSIHVFNKEVGTVYARIALGSSLVYAGQVEYGGSRNAAKHMVGSAMAKAPARFVAAFDPRFERLLRDLNL